MLAPGRLALFFLAGPLLAQRTEAWIPGASSAAAQGVSDAPSVRAHRKLDDATPGFRDVLEGGDRFGDEVAEIGDVDGDGVLDMAVTAGSDDDGQDHPNQPGNRGAVYVLFRRADGSLRARQKISATNGGFGGTLEPGSGFGQALAGLGDVDGDGVPDIAIGSPWDRAGTSELQGAIWICFLRRNGTVKGQVKINRSTPGILAPRNGRFGSALVCPGDWNGDGVPDLVAACVERSDLLWMIFLGRDGSVLSSKRSNAGLYRCGESLTLIDDLDGDGLRELATSRDRSVSVLFLGADGVLRSAVSTYLARGIDEVALTAGDIDGDGLRELILGQRDLPSLQTLHLNADGTLASDDYFFAYYVFGPSDVDDFGAGVAFLGDADGDGLAEVAFGAPGESSSFAPEGGTLHTCALGPGPTFHDVRKENDDAGVMAGTLDPGDGFGASATALGDLDGNGVIDLALGAPTASNNDLYHELGIVWLLLMEADGSVKARRRISKGEAGFTGLVDDHDRFGAALAGPGDLDADGTPDLVVGAPDDDDGQAANGRANLGAIWVLFLQPDGGVKKHVRISAVRGGFHGTLHAGDQFGGALAAAGDLDGNGTCDLFVGAPGDDDGGPERGAVWILHLRRDGSARFEKKLSSLAGGFGGVLPNQAAFGSALAAPGDVDGDGHVDLAVGAPGDSTVGFRSGAAWVLFLAGDGSVRGAQRIAQGDGGFTGALDGVDAFGSALAGPGDLDGDGVRDLLVGAPGDDDNAFDSGAVWVLSLDRDGRVARHVKIRTGSAGFRGVLSERDRFGTSLAVLGDGTGDGVPELAVGAPFDDEVRNDHGAFWLLVPDALASLGFEHRGDSTTALDGLALSSSDLGPLVTLGSAGANLGPALFESRAGGPNDPSQDPDLLVGRGKVLLLQNPREPVQTFPGYFDRPNDEPSGGLVRFELRRLVEARSLALVDIDAGSSARVTLTDAFGGRRVYDVPAGWTGDRIADGTAGVLRLDLRSLAPQAGFRGSATAAESPGFRADAVLTIEVELGGSGALDDLVLDPRP
jgi:VCBS repeat protein/FG-GAP repeat protein